MGWFRADWLQAGEGWRFLGIWGTLSCIIVLIIFLIHPDPLPVGLNRTESLPGLRSKRQTTENKDRQGRVTYKIGVREGQNARFRMRVLNMTNGRGHCYNEITDDNTPLNLCQPTRSMCSWSQVFKHTWGREYENNIWKWSAWWGVERNKDIPSCMLGIVVTSNGIQMKYTACAEEYAKDTCISFQLTDTKYSGKSFGSTNLPDVKDFLLQERNQGEIEGIPDENLWLRWMNYTARALGQTNCYACSTGRQTMLTAPMPQTMLSCVLDLGSNQEEVNCTGMGLARLKSAANPPQFTLTPGEYQCYRHRNGSRDLGDFNGCKTVVNVTDLDWEVQEKILNLTAPVTDVWWACSDQGHITQMLPKGWVGTCAPVLLVQPVRISHQRPVVSKIVRHKRSLVLDEVSSIWMNSIGIPRGASDQYKALNQIGEGFTTTSFWLALDMLLAEKGGVCRMNGLNNTSPEGTVTRALAGLTTLSEEWAENSGVNTSVTGWFDEMFGKWKTMLATIVGAAIVCMGMLVLCGCCFIPCVRGLVGKALENAATQQMVRYGPITESDQWNEEYTDPDLMNTVDTFNPEEPELHETIFNV
uniref:Envelope polyprotein n=1 Tax=Salmo trutta TaxID=8032 RepID=A0A674CAP3_SALTR